MRIRCYSWSRREATAEVWGDLGRGELRDRDGEVGWGPWRTGSFREKSRFACQVPGTLARFDLENKRFSNFLCRAKRSRSFWALCSQDAERQGFASIFWTSCASTWHFRARVGRGIGGKNMEHGRCPL